MVEPDDSPTPSTALPDGPAPGAWRVHTLVAGLPVAWAAFHLWEQWAAFGGREAWAARMLATSVGPAALVAELALGVLPALVWVALTLRLRGSQPEALRLAMAEDRALARRLGLLTAACSWVFMGWLLHHATWLVAPRLLRGADPWASWVALRGQLGTWAHAVGYALGLTGLAVHTWSALPRLAVAYGWVWTPEGRRAARLSGAILAIGLFLLYAQLAGWHAAGRGTVWSIDPPTSSP